MCLSPIRLYNPAKKISLYGGQKYVIDIPCGQCAECREARRTDIYFRAYYECMDTWSKNGYVYFDTLTYSTPNLPHVSDFVPKIKKGSQLDYSCFNKEDFRLFMVRLRRQLEYHGLDLKNQLKYFVASEYGSEQYTARPHYHVLFFVTGDIDPFTFSRYVNKCWQKGRTDGIDYHDSTYVLDHIYGPKYNSDMVHMQAVCNYVAKYVLKDSEFEGTLQKRIKAVFGANDDDYEGYLTTYDGQKYMKSLLKFMRPYTRWSKGFGVYGLDYNDDDLMYDGSMKIPDKNKVFRFAPLSPYLGRKKYSETAYDKNGKLYWRLTEEGKERLFKKTCVACENFADRFDEWLDNPELLMKKGDEIDVFDFEKCSWIPRDVTSQDIFKFRKQIENKVREYLGDRTSLDFAFYVMFYRGRVKSIEQNMRESKGIYRVDDVDKFFMRSLITKEEIDDLPDWAFVYNYAHSSDKRHFQQPIVGHKKLDCEIDGQKGYIQHTFRYGYDRNLDVYYGSFVDNYNKCHSDCFETAEAWSRRNVINEDSDPRFKDFDKLYALYISSLKYYNKRKQEAYDYIEDMKKRLKNTGFYLKTA